MASVQTTIPFTSRKKTALRLSSKPTGKENNGQDKSQLPVELEGTNQLLKRPSAGGGEGSPPKQSNVLTLKSPSHLIENIKLSSPDKKKPSICVAQKELFQEVGLSAASQVLHSTLPSTLPGREAMLKELEDILIKNLEEGTSDTVYVSGPPGTGKTACLSTLLAQSKILKGYKIVFINCTGMKSVGIIYKRLVSELGLKAGNSEKSRLAAIEKYLYSAHQMLLLVLDEMDEVGGKRSELYRVFQWSTKASECRLVLIGIANALDLTSRLFPRLDPTSVRLIHFQPYTKADIVRIIHHRLSQGGVGNVMSPTAVQMLASKVATVSGDIRKALDIARRAIDLAYSTNGKQVSMEEIMSVIGEVYATSESLGSASSYPLQQKLLIASMLLYRTNSKSKDLTVGKLHEVYKKVCQKRNLSAVDLSEFLALVELVESRGALRVLGKTRNRLSKVMLVWDEKEVAAALEDKQLLAAILSDVSCLPR